MGWKAIGHPTVRRQRDKWVVRVDGIDTETGKDRPRQLGTYASQRSALAAARSPRTSERSVQRGTVGWLIRRYVASRTDVTEKTREQYEWATTHVEAGLGAITLERLDRVDVAQWLDGMAAAGKLSRRSIQVCRTVLRAAPADAVDEGLLPRSPAARVGMPRVVAKPPKAREIDAWDEDQVRAFLDAVAEHRWAVAFRLGVLFGLRRSEMLALKWDDHDARAGTLRIDEGLVPVKGKAVWSETKNARSRRLVPLDDGTVRASPGTARSRPGSASWPVRRGRTTISSPSRDSADR